MPATRHFAPTLPGLLTLLLLGSAPARAQAQQWPWVTSPAPNTTGFAFIQAVVADATGGFIVTGGFSNTLILGGLTLISAGGQDVFVARFNPSSGWTQAAQAGGAGDDSGIALVLEPNGNIAVAGLFAGSTTPPGTTAAFGPLTLTSAGEYDIFVARLTPAGTWVQAVRAGSIGRDYASGLLTDSTGGLIVAGGFGDNPGVHSSADFGPLTLEEAGYGSADLFVARLDATGQWVQAVRAGGRANETVAAIAPDQHGGVVVTGTFGDYGVSADFGAIRLTPGIFTVGGWLRGTGYVARLNAAGDWTQAVALDTASNGYSTALCVTRDGTAVIAGNFGDVPGGRNTIHFGPTVLRSAGLADVFVARLDSAGTWTQAAQAGGPGGDVALAVALGPAGRTYVTGYYGYALGNPGLPAAFGATQLTSVGNCDVFVAGLDATGAWVNAIGTGGPDTEQVYDLVVDRQGGVVVAGIFTGTARIGNQLLSTGGGGGFFLAQTPSSLLATAPLTEVAPALHLTPNPARTEVRVAGSEPGQPLTLLDATGRVVKTNNEQRTTNNFNLHGLAPGLYLLRAADGRTARLVVE